MTSCLQVCFQTTKYIENSKLHASRRNVCHLKNNAIIDLYKIQFRWERQRKKRYYKICYLPNLLIVIFIKHSRPWTHSFSIHYGDKYFNIKIVILLLSSLFHPGLLQLMYCIEFESYIKTSKLILVDIYQETFVPSK